MDAPIDPVARRTIIEAHAEFYRFPIQLTRQPSDSLLGRLHRERERGTYTVINLAKITSVASQSAHTKHFEVVPGIAFSLGSHGHLLDIGGNSKALSAAQWLLNLRILYNGYSIVGIRWCLNQKSEE
eukprot:5412892-Pyramimonas_sp.AAC.1